MGYRGLEAFTLLVVAAAASGQSWTISNARLERTLVFAAGQGLRTTRLRNLDIGMKLLEANGLAQGYAAESAMDLDGRTLNGAGNQFRLLNGTVMKVPGGEELVVRLRAVVAPLDVDAVIACTTVSLRSANILCCGTRGRHLAFTDCWLLLQ